MAKTSVLFIAGWGRSGSTILGNILGQLPGFFYAGELWNLWLRLIVDDAMCGCGVRLSACPVWLSILGGAFGGIDQDLARRMSELKTGHRDVFLHTIVPHISTAHGRLRQAEYVQTLARLYSGIGNYGTNRVIVDSSKVAGYLYLLGQVPDLDLRIVHLVRDPRATTYSWLRKHVDAHGALVMPQLPVWESSGRWVTWNSMVPIVANLIGAPVMRIHYESFAANPRETLRSVLSFVDDICPAPEAAWPFVAPNEVELKETHTVWGNPSRERTGRVLISPDNEWSTALSGWRKAVVTGITYPLARQYGYFSARGSAGAAVGQEQTRAPSVTVPKRR